MKEGDNKNKERGVEEIKTHEATENNKKYLLDIEEENYIAPFEPVTMPAVKKDNRQKGVVKITEKKNPWMKGGESREEEKQVKKTKILDETKNKENHLLDKEEKNNVPQCEPVTMLEIHIKETKQVEKPLNEITKLKALDATLSEKQEAKAILKYFTGLNEILFFEDVEGLENTIIPVPMNLTKCLRTVISHKACESLKGIDCRKAKINLRNKGLLSHIDFQILYNQSPNNPFSVMETWNFLINLGLACPLKTTKGDQIIFVPSLITDETEDIIRTKEEEMVKCHSSLTIQYAFDRKTATNKIFFEMMKVIAEIFLWGENAGEIHKAFCQKIENRKIGCWGLWSFEVGG